MVCEGMVNSVVIVIKSTINIVYNATFLSCTNSGVVANIYSMKMCYYIKGWYKG